MSDPSEKPIAPPGGPQALLRAIVDDCLVLVLALEASQGQTAPLRSLRRSLVALSLEIQRVVPTDSGGLDGG